MKLYKARQLVRKRVAYLLSNALLIDGATLNITQLKNENKPIFWYISSRNIEASSKEVYVVYNITSLDPNEYGDGEALLYNTIVDITIFSRRENIDELLKKINNAFDNDKWFLQFVSDNYNVSDNVFVCSLKAYNVIGG